MFTNLKNMLAGQSGSVSPELDQENLDPFADMEQEEKSPEEILDDPESSYEMQKIALQQIKDRYLKPREENE